MHRTASLIFVASVLWTAAVAVAQAPPGSTGGTIGKQDKSISGGNTPEESRPSTRKQEPHPSAAKGSSCGRIAGTWDIAGGTTVVAKPDGSAHNSFGNVDGTADFRHSGIEIARQSVSDRQHDRKSPSCGQRRKRGSKIRRSASAAAVAPRKSTPSSTAKAAR